MHAYSTPDVIIQPYSAASGGADISSPDHFWNGDEADPSPDPDLDMIADAGGVDLANTSTFGYSATGAPDSGACRESSGSHHFEETIDLSGITEVTFCLWYRTVTSNGALLSFQKTSGNYLRTDIITGGANMRAYNDSSFAGTASGVSTYGVWHSFAIATDETSEEFFINGSSVLSTSNGFDFGSGTFFVGSAQNGTSEINGRVMCAGIYKGTKWGSAEASAHYNSGTPLRFGDL